MRVIERPREGENDVELLDLLNERWETLRFALQGAYAWETSTGRLYLIEAYDPEQPCVLSARSASLAPLAMYGQHRAHFKTVDEAKAYAEVHYAKFPDAV